MITPGEMEPIPLQINLVGNYDLTENESKYIIIRDNCFEYDNKWKLLYIIMFKKNA